VLLLLVIIADSNNRIFMLDSAKQANRTENTCMQGYIVDDYHGNFDRYYIAIGAINF
jgi:hypothetical protein